MNLKVQAARIGLLAVILLAGSILAAPSTSARQSKPPVFWIDLMGTAQMHPRMVFFTANAGPQVHSIKWTGWGKKRAVGRGIYRVTSPPPPGGKNPKGPARIVTWKPERCVPEFGSRKGKKTWVYSKARMLRPVSEGGRKWVDITAYTGRLSCK